MHPIDPCTLVIFGAGGNLSRIKLMPGLYRLEQAGRLPEKMAILSVGREELSREQWLDEIKAMLDAKFKNGLNKEALARFLSRMHYHANPPGDGESYQRMKNTLDDNTVFPPNIIFYMSVRPSEFPEITDHLGKMDLLKEHNNWRRVVIEKPFGYDLISAQTLQKALYKHLNEPQIYRIDHYLGKGTVQNIMVFRFANMLLEPIWNRHYIDHVQITHSETIGVGDRTHFYDSTGALRDMIQSHLLQLIALVAMEAPVNMTPENLRDEKVKVLKAIRPIPQNAVHAHAFRAQYSSGSINGQPVPGYLEEPGVPEESVTETYAALKLYVDNWRWAGVPFYVSTGKRMAEGSSAISIRFKNPPQDLLHNHGRKPTPPNWLLLGIQPNECLKMELQAKVPGLDLSTRSVSLDATYKTGSDEDYDAYESLLLDVMEGDQSLFLRMDEVEWAWRVVDPVIKLWSVERDFINTYQAGSWGPRGTYRLFDREDQFWRHSLELDGANLQPY